MIDRTVSHYKILAQLGEGGMGTVYRGVDTMLDRPVAIKVLHPHISRQPDVLERFRSEAALLARLSDPHIATLYSFFRESDEFFMVMEFVNGQTLATLMHNHTTVAPEQAVAVSTKVLSGLDHAHSVGILHRDITPANILVTGQGAVKITDFGIARAFGSQRLTRDLRVIGTLEYVAPERIRGEEGDLRSDLYSVGVVLYELLTGRLPFERDSDFELMRAHLEEMPLPLRDYSPLIPPALEALVFRALAKRPEDRFSDAREMRDALNAADLHPAPSPTRFAEPAPVLPRTQFVELETQLAPAPLPPASTRSFSRSALWLGIVSASVLALVLIFILVRVANHSSLADASGDSPQNTAATPAPPVTSEKPNPPPVALAPATISPPASDTPKPSASDTPRAGESAAQQRRAQRAKRKAAALQALDQ